MDLKTLQKSKKDIETKIKSLSQELAVSEDRLGRYLEILEKDHGVASTEEAQKKLEEMEKEIVKHKEAEVKFQKELDEIMEKQKNAS